MLMMVKLIISHTFYNSIIIDCFFIPIDNNTSFCMIHFLVNIIQILANRNVHHPLDDIKKEKSAPLPTKRGAAQSKSAASF